VRAGSPLVKTLGYEVTLRLLSCHWTVGLPQVRETCDKVRYSANDGQPPIKRRAEQNRRTKLLMSRWFCSGECVLGMLTVLQWIDARVDPDRAATARSNRFRLVAN
jgi:hypothetical protein